MRTIACAFVCVSVVRRITQKYCEQNSGYLKDSPSATLIDNIFTNDMISNLVPSILCSDMSDHFPVFVTSSVKIPCRSDKFIYKCMYSDNNRANFLQNLCNIDWSDIVDPVEHMSADTLYSAFIQ